MKNIIIFLTFIIPNVVFSQWVVSNSGTELNLRTVHFPNLMTGYAAGEGGLVIKTTNNGQSWVTLDKFIFDDINSIYFLNASSGIACSNSGVIISTSNGGANWTSVSSGVTDNLYGVSFFNNLGISSGSGGTLLYTTNSGANWSIAENGFFIVYNGAHMVNENLAFACGSNTIFQPFIAKSINGGANWTFANFYLNGSEGTLTDIHFISESEGFASARVFDGTGGIAYTSNGGDNWSTQLFASHLTSIEFTGMNIGYAVGGESLILKTTDRGVTWVAQTNPGITTLNSVDFVDSLNGFAVGINGVVLKTTNGGLTSISDPTEINPGKFFLSQNYPNPFNPVTIINYELTNSGIVTLQVYDALGKVVKTLVNSKQNSGSYSITFDGNDFPAGIYFYKLEINGYSQTKKFILLK